MTIRHTSTDDETGTGGGLPADQRAAREALCDG